VSVILPPNTAGENPKSVMQCIENRSRAFGVFFFFFLLSIKIYMSSAIEFSTAKFVSKLEITRYIGVLCNPRITSIIRRLNWALPQPIMML